MPTEAPPRPSRWDTQAKQMSDKVVITHVAVYLASQKPQLRMTLSTGRIRRQNTTGK